MLNYNRAVYHIRRTVRVSVKLWTFSFVGFLSERTFIHLLTTQANKVLLQCAYRYNVLLTECDHRKLN